MLERILAVAEQGKPLTGSQAQILARWIQNARAGRMGQQFIERKDGKITWRCEECGSTYQKDDPNPDGPDAY